MYWAHRNLHANKFLWRHIHALHHLAKSPVARTTQMDHWLDNFINAVIGETCTQLLFPLPLGLLLPLRCFRMAEGLEKHSGLTGWPNLIHLAQRWFPCAQQPHHHDW
jgi:sphinganine C4-monooxygenase